VELTVLAVGKLRPDLRAIADDYLTRLGRYAKVHEVEVKEASRASSIEAQRAEEAIRLERRRPAAATLIALARQGEPWSSQDLARRVAEWQLGARPVALAIGGSHGLGETLLGSARLHWSLGPLTLPHELARVVVLEQLYRAFTILAGGAYHKGR
jgi:23S rRNA (pseudouridine1915-N3)-methyltransferase